MITLLYCAGGNRRLVQIATDAGFAYGARLPDTIYPDVAPLAFADQEWRKPNRAAYLAALAVHRPALATCLDWERPEQLPEVLGWAEDVAAFVETVLIIPKVSGGIGVLPRRIGGKPVRLAFSVPTRFGGTSVPTWEFRGWPVHLLGGSPQAQMAYAHYFHTVSADGNYMQKMAVQWCQFWAPGDATYAANRYWPRLREADGQKWGIDAPYEAFRRSCANIMSAWRRLLGGPGGVVEQEGEAA